MQSASTPNAGLPVSSCNVWVGPPLLARVDAKPGEVLVRLEPPAHVGSEEILMPDQVTDAPLPPAQLPPPSNSELLMKAVLFAAIVRCEVDAPSDRKVENDSASVPAL